MILLSAALEIPAFVQAILTIFTGAVSIVLTVAVSSFVKKVKDLTTGLSESIVKVSVLFERVTNLAQLVVMTEDKVKQHQASLESLPVLKKEVEGLLKDFEEEVKDLNQKIFEIKSTNSGDTKILMTKIRAIDERLDERLTELEDSMKILYTALEKRLSELQHIVKNIKAIHLKKYPGDKGLLTQ